MKRADDIKKIQVDSYSIVLRGQVKEDIERERKKENWKKKLDAQTKIQME